MSAVVAVWWLVLLLALVLTVLAVLQIVRIVDEAREIRRLVHETVAPARGIAANTAAVGELAGLLAPAGRIVQAAAAIERTAAAIEGRVAGLARALRGS